ncbi:MAG TPA: hypothetical protein VFN38_01130 [Gemmatimonadaceae bacterium]|nr:hypothetical protein [Gemmatimonadaceae bacterium]
MRTRLLHLLAFAAFIIPCPRARAQACLAAARPTFVTTPRGDSLEIVSPSLLPLADGLLMFGSGATIFRADAPPRVEAPLLAVRLRRGTVEMIAPPAPGGRYLYPRVAQDARGGIHLLWGEPDTARTLPAARGGAAESGSELTQALWAADYLSGAWSPPRRLGTVPGTMWSAVSPSRPTGRSSVMTAVGYIGPRGRGVVDIHHADRSRWTVQSVVTDGLTAYTSVAPAGGGLVVGYIAVESGGELRPRNTVFITDSLPGDSAWSRPIALGGPGDQAATMLALLPGRAGTVHAVWGQNLDGGLHAQAIRHATLDLRGRVQSPPRDLRVSGVVQALHAEPDARGGAHVVFQGTGADDRPRAYYAYWSPTRGWSRPASLSGDAYSRAPAIAATTGDSVYITWAAHIGMTGPFPRFATAVVRAGSGARCVP